MSQTTKSKLSRQPVEEEANLTSQTKKDPVSSARQKKSKLSHQPVEEEANLTSQTKRTQCQPDNKDQAVSPAS